MNKMTTLDNLMSDYAKSTNALTGENAELRFIIDIKRAATGETETVELIGKITNDDTELPQDPKESLF